MPTLSMVDMGRYLIGAGFPSNKVARMIAIGQAESSGNTDAIGPPPDQPPASDGGRGYGVWQIESVHGDLFPNFFPPSTAWKDPARNAAAAKVVYDRQGLNAWTSNTNGSADQYNSQAQAAYLQALALGGTTPSSVLAGAQDVAGSNPVTQAIQDVAKEPLAVLDWIKQPGTWVRIVKLGVGSVAILLGIRMVFEAKVTFPIASKALNVVAGVSPTKAATNAVRRTKSAQAVQAATAAKAG